MLSLTIAAAFSGCKLKEDTDKLVEDVSASYDNVVNETKEVIEEVNEAKAKVEETIEDVKTAKEKVDEASDAIKEVTE